MFVLSAIGLVAALLFAGCAETAQVIAPAPEQVQITVHPWRKPIRLVRKTPPPERYLYVGKVRAVARDVEFVDAARTVDAELRSKARALGADVVKIDAVYDRKHAVVMAGRAYRSMD
ncbi:MAG TPA: hypothetical protein VFF06_20485 [Polyangia bacterium]|nr:hypothetical protein [Polyangia bacterium]